jgi:DNA-binding response OmpR family regulator
MSKPFILVVEDDPELQGLLTRRLNESGYRVRAEGDGLDALAAIEEETPDLLLLDVMLPGMDGLDVCKKVRTNHPLLYIIMLTARADEVDRVVGLEVGADDYVTKPFSLSELVARVRSALRRVRLTQEAALKTSEQADVIAFAGLNIDVVRRRVIVRDHEVQLTVLEYDLLLFLAQNVDRPFTRLQLLDKVWDIQ